MRAAIESGQEIPDSIRNRPTLSIGSIFFWDAFVELNSCRGEGNIPWTAIDRYAERYEVEEDLFEELVDVISALDEAMLQHRDKKRGKK